MDWCPVQGFHWRGMNAYEGLSPQCWQCGSVLLFQVRRALMVELASLDVAHRKCKASADRKRNRWSPELWASAQQLSGPRRQLSQMEAGFTLCSLKLSCSLSDATEGTGLQFYSNFFSLIPHDKHIGGKKIWNMDACRRWGLLPVYDWRSHFDGLTWMMESCMIVEDLSISYL